MADVIKIDVDTAAVDSLCARLSGQRLTKALRGLERQPLRTLRNGVKQELSARTKKHRVRQVWKSGPRTYKSPRPLWQDIKMTPYKRGPVGGVVGLLTPKRYGNRAFVLRILNRGTKQRVTKKGARRGSGPALLFFEAGVARSRQAAAQAFNAGIRKELRKLMKS